MYELRYHFAGRLIRAASLLVLASLILGGCGTAASSTSDVGRSAAQTSAQVSSVEDDLRDLAAAINGTPDQWRVAVALEYAAFHGPLAACVEQHGQSYRYPPRYDTLAGRSQSLIPDTYTALAELPTTRGLVPRVADTVAATYRAVQDYRGSVALSSADADYIAALDACGGTTGDARAPEWPVADPDLESAFLELMRSAQDAPTVTSATADWAPCMAAKGYSVVEETDLYQLVSGYYTEFAVNPDDPAATRAPEGPEWDAAVAKEVAAAHADLACRNAAHDAAMLALDGKIDAFRDQHAAQLAAARAFWSDLSTRAATTAAAD